MATSYNWTVYRMESIPQIDDKTDVVIQCYWNCLGSNSGYSAHIYDDVALEYNPNNSFISYADLTPEIVLGWVKTVLGDKKVAEIENSIDSQIRALINPAKVSLPLPWEK